MSGPFGHLHRSPCSPSPACSTGRLCLHTAKPHRPLLHKTSHRRHVRRRGAAGRLQVQAISMPRSWHAFRMNVRYSWVNLQDQFWSLPAVAALVQSWHRLQRPVVEAYLKVWGQVKRWGQDRLGEFDDFCTEENIREWKWRRQNEQEWELWRKIVLAATGVVFTVIWEAIVPTSLFWALVPPLWAAWTLYDNWIQSPFVLGLLIMLPLKFPPYGPWRWF